MFKRLLIGAALGVLGKKLYDEGKLDPYIGKASAKPGETDRTEAKAPDAAYPGGPTT